jgi:hypothetical protein
VLVQDNLLGSNQSMFSYLWNIYNTILN